MSHEGPHNFQNKDTSRRWGVFSKSSKNDTEDLNDSLLKHIELLEKENMKLKEAISEIHNDNKQKENSLEESHKIITKLNEEYNKLLKEFKIVEHYATQQEAENIKNKKLLEEGTKSYLQLEKIQKHNASLKNELEQTKKDSQSQKTNLQCKSNDSNKMEKELKEKTNFINEYKSKIQDYKGMIEEREKVISDYDDKFQEISGAFIKKEEECRYLLKITQEIGSENKYNVEELTKQAMNTIKVFYNSLNNSNSKDDSRVFITSFTNNNLFINRQEIENLIKEKKFSFLLENAIRENIGTDRNCISRESLQNLNLNIELLKTELFGSLMREINIVKYLGEIIPNDENIFNGNNNISVGSTVYNSSSRLIMSERDQESKNSEDAKRSKINLGDSLINYIENLKASNEELEKELQKNKKELQRSLDYQKDVHLYILKLKDSTKDYINKIIQRFEKMEKNVNANVSVSAHKLKSINLQNDKQEEQLNYIENLNKILKSNKEELKSSLLEISFLKKENECLSRLRQNLEKDNETLIKLRQDLEKDNETLVKLRANLERENESLDRIRENLEKEKYELVLKLEKRDSMNESFNERNYFSKKEENSKLKNEIERLKDEISNLIRTANLYEIKIIELNEMKFNLQISKGINLSFIVNEENILNNSIHNKNLQNKNQSESINKINPHNDENKFAIDCQNCVITMDKIMEFKNSILKLNHFKDVKQFYISHQMDIEKVSSKIDEVTTKFYITEGKFSNENVEKKIKVSQVKEILSIIGKLISLLSNYINKYNKDVYYYTSNLNKIFDFVSKLVYSNNFTNSFSSLGSSSKFPFQLCTNVGMNMKTSTELILKLFYEFNGKIFSPSDFKNIYAVYQNRSVIEIIEIFKLNCEVIKNNKVEKLDYETEFSEAEDSFSKNYKRKSDFVINNSYKIVNQRILKLKKFEFDFTNIVEILKNYFVAQEIIVKNLFNEINSNFINNSHKDKSNEMTSSDPFKTAENFKNKLDIIDKIIYITQDTLFHKVSDTDEELMFIRKVIFTFIKNQKNSLKISIENF